MRILVTGATGFIGRNLVDDLLAAGHVVCALCRDPLRASRILPPSVRIIRGDVSELASLRQAAEQPFDAIVHCAARVVDHDWPALQRANVLGTHNVCSLAKRLGCRLVYLSSVAVVSEQPNLYGRSKIEAEKIVMEYRDQGVAAAIIRPTMVYGEGEPHLLDLILWLLYWRLMPLFNRGRNRMHLAYVKNVTAALMAALEKDAFLEGTFFVADDDVLTVREIFDAFSAGLGRKPAFDVPDGLTAILRRLPGMEQRMSFFLKDRVYSLDRIHAAGYRQAVPAITGLRRSAQDWLRRQGRRC